MLNLDGVIPHRAADDVATSLAYARLLRTKVVRMGVKAGC